MKKSKKLNIAQRVEIILREGVDRPETWMGVERYTSKTPSIVEYARLLEHHKRETNFLLEVIKELREQVLALDEQLDKKLSS